MYNTTVGNFNKYHLEEMSDKEIITYSKLIIKDASSKENEMNKNDTWATNYKFASASTNVSHIIKHLNERGLISSDFQFGFIDDWMYGAENIESLLNVFE